MAKKKKKNSKAPNKNMYTEAVLFADKNSEASEEDILKHLRKCYPFTDEVKRREAAGEPRRRSYIINNRRIRVAYRTVKARKKKAGLAL